MQHLHRASQLQPGSQGLFLFFLSLAGWPFVTFGHSYLIFNSSFVTRHSFVHVTVPIRYLL